MTGDALTRSVRTTLAPAPGRHPAQDRRCAPAGRSAIPAVRAGRRECGGTPGRWHPGPTRRGSWAALRSGETRARARAGRRRVTRAPQGRRILFLSKPSRVLGILRIPLPSPGKGDPSRTILESRRRRCRGAHRVAPSPRGARPGTRIVPKAGEPRRSPALRGEGGTRVRAPFGNAAGGAGSRAIRPAWCASHPRNRKHSSVHVRLRAPPTERCHYLEEDASALACSGTRLDRHGGGAYPVALVSSRKDHP